MLLNSHWIPVLRYCTAICRQFYAIRIHHIHNAMLSSEADSNNPDIRMIVIRQTSTRIMRTVSVVALGAKSRSAAHQKDDNQALQLIIFFNARSCQG